ncbi:Global transcription regulator sge1 [Umbelopsis sp. WA50703]
MPTSLDPTFHGFVETTMDTLLLFEACRQNLLPKVTRRLQDRERKELVASGTVFIFDEKESGIKRWTDGLLWSPSRILGNFLVYREIDKRSPIVDKRQQTVEHSAPTSTAERLKERALVGSLTNSYKFKKNGLIKKTMSIVVNGSTQHMISYYNKEDVASGRLQSPRSIPMLANLDISADFLQRQNFRIPLHVEASGMSDRASTSPTMSSAYYDTQRRESQASSSSDYLPSESPPIDTRNYLTSQVGQTGFSAPTRYSPYQYVDGHHHPQHYPSVSMPNTPIPSPSQTGFRIRKSSDSGMMYQNRGTLTDPIVGGVMTRHPFSTSSSPLQQQGNRSGLEMHAMPPPQSNMGASNESYDSMGMNWPSYQQRSDPRLPSTAGPYETSFSFPSTAQRHNYQTHSRNHSDPRQGDPNASFTGTHLPPIMQNPLLNSFPSPGDAHVQPADPNAIPPLSHMDETSYRGGGNNNEAMHHGLLEHNNNMRIMGGGVPYHSSTLAHDPRGGNDASDQFNNVPMGSNFNAAYLPSAFEQWHTLT